MNVVLIILFYFYFQSFCYMSGGSVMDIYFYWVDVYFFSDQAETFFLTFWTSRSKNLQ